MPSELIYKKPVYKKFCVFTIPNQSNKHFHNFTTEIAGKFEKTLSMSNFLLFFNFSLLQNILAFCSAITYNIEATKSFYVSNKFQNFV